MIKARVIAPLLAVGIVAAACSSAPSRSAPQRANDDINLGLRAEQAGDLKDAQSYFTSAAQLQSSNALPYYDLGTVYQEQGNVALAVAEYQKALLANPNFSQAIYNLAVIETKLDPAEAVTLYRQLLKINPNDIDGNFNLGLLLYGQGQQVQGVVLIKKAIALQPSLSSRVPANVHLTP